MSTFTLCDVHVLGALLGGGDTCVHIACNTNILLSPAASEYFPCNEGVVKGGRRE